VAKAKPALARATPNLGNYKFDTSKYILLKGAVSRDASTGRLVEKKAAPSSGGKAKSK
jgi:hypothetical protein